jgi:hypothetical protein
MYSTWSRVKRSRRSLLTAATALWIAFGSSAVAHAQATITLPTTCVTVPGNEEPNTGGAFGAGTGLIQNFGQSFLSLNCSISRPPLGRSANATVTIDALTQGATPGSGPVPPLEARLMAVATPPGGGTTFMFVNFRTRPGVTTFQRVTSAQFPMPLNDDFGVFLRVTLNRFDILGRILFRLI